MRDYESPVAVAVPTSAQAMSPVDEELAQLESMIRDLGAVQSQVMARLDPLRRPGPMDAEAVSKDDPRPKSLLTARLADLRGTLMRQYVTWRALLEELEI